MARVDIALVEWPDCPDLGGPRLLGRLDDPELVEAIRSRIASARRRELTRLESPVRPLGVRGADSK